MSRNSADPSRESFAGLISFYDTLFYFGEETGKLTPKQIVPALPDTGIRAGWSSAIDLDKDGRFLYTTDRTYNIVSQFEIDPSSGRIRLVGTFLPAGRSRAL